MGFPREPSYTKEPLPQGLWEKQGTRERIQSHLGQVRLCGNIYYALNPHSVFIHISFRGLVYTTK